LRRLRSVLPILALVSIISGTRASAEFTDSTAAQSHPLFTRGDAWFAAAAVTSVALATRLDRWAAEEAPENNGSLAVGMSHAVERLGNPLYVVPAFLVFRAADALEHRSDRSASLVRIAEGAVAASAAVSVVKLAVGRARPYQTPGDQDVVRPFSGNSSFPSGHTALAFGIAAAIDKETSARWVPFVVYPLAGLVGWSRMRDGEHWSSDVVAGAALGFWTARKAVEVARRRIHTP
jgi:membrane-associated phospholipid phosphatase